MAGGMRNQNRYIESVAESTLADHLRNFYAEVKTSNGKEFTPSSMTSIRAAIHRKLTAPLHNRGTCMNIMKVTSFLKVYDGNNNNSVYFVGNFVHFRPL